MPFFRRSKKPKLPPLLDLEDNPLKVGDTVESLRYDLGKSIIIDEDGEYFYESLKSGERVHWLKMVDASTERQKVKKISD